MKVFLKRSKLLIALVHRVRSMPSLIQREALAVIFAWSNRNRSRRLIQFEALPQRFAYAEHSRESYFVSTDDEVIGQRLYARGDFDFNKFEKAYRLVMKACILDQTEGLPVLIDVGANLGSICIPAVKRGFVSRCIAIEPDKENSHLLEINLLLNNVQDDVTIYRAAAGDQTGIVSLSRNSKNSGDHRVVTETGESVSAVSMLQLDSLAFKLNLSNTIVWMDIQGYEGFALQGATRFIAATVPIVFEFTKQDLVAADCYDLLIATITESNYKFFYDLNEDTPEKRSLCVDALDQLAARLDAVDSFTDILLLPA